MGQGQWVNLQAVQKWLRSTPDRVGAAGHQTVQEFIHIHHINKINMFYNWSKEEEHFSFFVGRAEDHGKYSLG